MHLDLAPSADLARKQTSVFDVHDVIIPSLPTGHAVFKMSTNEMATEDKIKIDEVEMGDVTTADGILAKEKEKFEYIHGHVEHQQLHVPPLEELCKGRHD